MTTIKTLLFTLCLIPIAQAEVITDGSLGAKVELPGKDFQITPQLGQQVGGNLFHSFQNFNLSESETATFSGATGIQNVIARVTGGQASSIDGTLRSTIPNADLYFLNPYGIMFGQHAKLDLQGGFHATTADYLKLQDGGRFDARTLNNSLLTVAPVASFGFLTDSPATLELQNSQLSVPYGQSFSLMGGNISLNQAQVNAPGGQVTLSSLAQTGQLALTNPTLSGKGGIISLQNQSKVSASGIGGGKVLIRGGQLVMNNSAIEAATLGNQEGQGIDIATSEAVTVKGDVLAIAAPTLGSGKGGNIQIATPRLELTGSYIDTSSLGSGNGGDIDIQANQVTLLAGGSVGGNLYGGGDGGLVKVTAHDSVTVAGYRKGDFNLYGLTIKDFSSSIGTNSFSSGRTGSIEITTHHLISDGGFISIDSVGLSEARNITITADLVTLKDGGFIGSDTFGDHAGGNITLKVAGDLTIMGRKPTVTVFPPPFNVVIEDMQSVITSSTLGKGSAGRITISANRLVMQEGGIGSTSAGGTGPAGPIQITVNELQINPGARITSNSGVLLGKTLFLGTGDGGEVQVEVTGLLRIQGRDLLDGVPSGIFSNTITTGRGGNVKVRANHLQLSDGGMIAANSLGAGDAGGLTIQANTLEIFDQGQLTTSAQYAGGGDIHVTAANLLYLRQGQITTSVAIGQGSGGNITIEQPQFIVLNQAQIKAQADAGQGGNIRIAAAHFVPSVESLVSASSNLGIDGQVTISSPTEDVGNQVLSLAANYLNAASLFPRSCAARIADQRPSQFVRPFTLIVKPKTMIHAPEDTRGSPYPVTMHYKWFDQYR